MNYPFFLLLLLPSLAFCQSNYIIEDLNKEGSIQALKMNLGKKFDVTGGTITSRMYITSSITITGAGHALIFPDGTRQTTAGVGDVVLTATQTFTGGNTFVQSSTFSGTINLPNRDKIIFGNELSNSSSTKTAATYSTTQTSFNECITGSTLTITTNKNSRIIVGITGSWYSPTTNQTMYATYMLDGVEYQGNAGITTTDITDMVNLLFPISFTAITETVSAGSHSVCFAIRSNGGASINFYVDANNTNQLWIRELR